ncbi:MAG: T9SS type A sorting domain-containing protein [Crocinitomix sp.]|nr:T9SS type A sorting domain-containing protein [Crocinitomix sp.]
MNKLILGILGTFLFAGITFAADLEAVVTESDPGESTGGISLDVTGGVAPFVFDWTGPGGFSSTAEDLTDLEAGTYSVTVTDNYCGIATLEVVVTNGDHTSIKEEMPFEISLYPNPTNGLLNIQSSVPVDIVVYNVVGEIILSAKNATQIDLGNQPRGIYMVQLTSDKGTVTRKVTLQ